MLSTMQEFPLTVTSILRHGERVHARSEVVTCEGEGSRRASFAEVGRRVRQLAGALAQLGIRAGDRVATLGWNTQEHLEAYLAVPAMGAVVHTLNIRLHPDQLAWIVNHAEDRVLLVDAVLVPLLLRFRDRLQTIEHVVVMGDGEVSALGPVVRYAELLAGQSEAFEWPELDERAAAAMCYTSGTTGDPKGVVYSHRSIWLHSLAACAGGCFALAEGDRILPVVPMFHAMAWGLPYAAWMVGASLILPGRFLAPEPLCRLIAAERPTFAGAVPTVWNDLLRYAESAPVELRSLRLVVCGGSAVPLSLMQRFAERHGVRIVQAWGMTETSPLGAIAHPPPDIAPSEEWDWRSKTGRVVPGVELRLVDDGGQVLPWDGRAVGEIQVRGPWVTARYHRDPAPEKFDRGWLRTGDVGTVDERGFIRITDRAKDVIKSGGEWICSVELEGALMNHPEVVEAAVIGVPDERWHERPLACVVRRPGSTIGAEELRTYLWERVARFWVPERFAFIDQVPRTGVGKFDKKELRVRFAAGGLDVWVGPAPGSRK
jgi:fatty-acyl-CoA synthase